MFDPIVASPSGKGKSPASSSATNYTFSAAAARDRLILDKQAKQEEKLRQICSPVSSLGSELRTVVVKVVADKEVNALRIRTIYWPVSKEKEKSYFSQSFIRKFGG